MQFVRIAIIILFSVVFLKTGTYAQTLSETSDLSVVKIDSYTDEELTAFYEKATSTGMTDAQLLTMVESRGLPATEVTKLRNRLGALNLSQGSFTSQSIGLKKANSNSSNDQNNQRLADTSVVSKSFEEFKIDKTIFGSELFTKNSMAFEPNLRIATPAGYILGPDDEIVLVIYGYSEKSYNLRVNEDGFIYIQNIGPLYVNGLTIEQANEKIKTKLASTVYRAIKSGQTKVQISLSKIRSVRVTVIGEARKPGTFTVSSLTTLFNILYLCGGPTDMGSYRNIELIRGDHVKRTADLYSFLLKGNQTDNILLQEGDVIRIPYYSTRISINGEVKREGKFELKNNETFKDVLGFCGGLKDDAYKASVSIIRVTDKANKMIDLSADEFASFTPQGSDSIYVRKLMNKFENRIQINGSVYRPGAYQFSPGMGIKNLIEKAGGITADAYTKRVAIFRYNQNMTTKTLAFDLDSILLTSSNNVSLQTNDSVFVHSIFEFKDNYTVSVKGQVRKPGEYKWRENMTLKDVILLIGGLNDFGDSATIEISRRIRNADVTKVNHVQTNIFNINIKNEHDPSTDILLNPFDVIIVKSLPGYIGQRSVLIQGEVMSPGEYTLRKSGERISDMFGRIGGFKASADTTAVTIRRYIHSQLSMDEREKIFKRVLNINQDSLKTNDALKTEVYKTYDLISINLGLALSNPNNSENLILEDGDIITVDRNTKIVKVSGEVNFPTLIPLDISKNLKYYINRAGGYTNNAKRSRTMVIYSDGKARTLKHFLFIKHFPRITSRSEIYIPAKAVRVRNRITATELALIVSGLGILANIMISTKLIK